MKKVILSLLVFSSYSPCLQAQWTLSGNNVYTTTPANSVVIGATAPSLINASSGLFAGVTPKQEILTGNATTTYSELVAIRHSGASVDAVSRQLGMVFKLSSENTTAESNKMGGLLLESSNAYGNYPSLSLMTGNARRLTIDYNGNIGVSTLTPTSKLQLNETSDSKPGGTVALTKSVLKLSRYGTPNYSYNESAEFRVGHGGPNVWGSRLDLYINGGSNINDIPDQQAMTWTYNGNVGIGTTNPQNKLDVNGTIHSKQVNIDLTGWSDFVFKKNYKLRPLNEVKDYIDKNQHLPEIPSEQEMLKKGLDVSEMNKLLIKKVEELTLYLIKQEKQLETVQKEIKLLKKNKRA